MIADPLEDGIFIARCIVEIFYNRICKQARLGYLSPAAFNQQYYANQIAA